MFNLITEAWIPIVRKNGQLESIRPCDITSHFDTNPVVRFNVSRPDFKGSLILFAIGLVQTTLPPIDSETCYDLYTTPPSPETLQSAFLNVIDAFNIHGAGPLFMQDFDSLDNFESNKIAQLFVDETGNKGLENNTDFFIKRGRFDNGLSLSETTMALFWLQQNAPSGGVGYRTSLRGGGPLTTILIPESDETLWRLIWANISISKDPLPSELNTVFPWLSPTPTSEYNATVTPNNAHALQAFWGMPRRIRIVYENGVAMKYKTKNYGINYPSIAWRHPLTPYRSSVKEPDKFLPVLTPKGRLFYENWLDITMGDSNFHLAKCIQENNCNIKAKILCFGYEHDNFKPLAWVETISPYYNIPDSIRDSFITAVKDMISNAKITSKALFSSVDNKPERGGRKRTSKDNGDKAQHEFWARTESKFFDMVEQKFHNLKSNQDDELMLEWNRYLYTTVLNLFSEYVESGRFDLETQVINKNELKMRLSKLFKIEDAIT